MALAVGDGLPGAVADIDGIGVTPEPGVEPAVPEPTAAGLAGNGLAVFVGNVQDGAAPVVHAARPATINPPPARAAPRRKPRRESAGPGCSSLSCCDGLLSFGWNI